LAAHDRCGAGGLSGRLVQAGQKRHHPRLKALQNLSCCLQVGLRAFKVFKAGIDMS
jgi:hypothetical protein